MENYEQYRAKIEKAIKETQEHFKKYFDNLDEEELKDFNNYVTPYKAGCVAGIKLFETWENLPIHIKGYFYKKVQA
ncbi:hypothetical protein [Sphingobacterium cellulitidis]|uniref:hypothetical protein n=1 Tax=Sphingobacterium cellulitidis TaxID=1768011 RepID=UPI000B93AD68|nr:hypothetical protein CHT99_10385 [Sphingobacterium cellulitidis]